MYWFGLSQVSSSPIGTAVAAAGAVLLVLLFIVFVHGAFRGQTRWARWRSRFAVALFMTAAALMTSTLFYKTTFVTGYADRKAFGAVHTLTLYANQSSNAFAVAAARYTYAAKLSKDKANLERSSGGTYDGSGKGPNGARNIWRDSFANQMSVDAKEISGMQTQMQGLSGEISAFGKSFNPLQRSNAGPME